MFAKLLKHEWKSTGALLGILSVGALGIGVLAAVVLRILVTNGSKWMESESLFVLLIPMLGTMLVFLFVALIAYMLGTQVFLLIRFYRNKFTDEGYLTFTLPVNAHQIFLSSALYILIWQIISGVVAAAAVNIALLFGTAQEGILSTEILDLSGAILPGSPRASMIFSPRIPGLDASSRMMASGFVSISGRTISGTVFRIAS